MQDNTLNLTLIFLFFFGILIYFLPSIIARKKRDVLSIFLLNFFLGATGIGWVIALVWACKKDAEPTIIHLEKNEQPALNSATYKSSSRGLVEPFNPIMALIRIVITVAAVIAMIALISYLFNSI